MSKFGLDGVGAWFLAAFLAAFGFGTSYFLVDVAAKDPANLMLEEIETMEREKAQAASEFETNQQGEADSEVRQEETQDSEGQIAQNDHNESESLMSNWSYRGKNGPDFWGHLDRSFLNCKIGREQSPIDINNPMASEEDISFRLQYRSSKLRIHNNGQTFVGSFDPGSYVEYKGEIYNLKEFSLHLPSEHTVDGIPRDMEMQFLHYNSQGKALSVGVFLEEGLEPNQTLSKIWDLLPMEEGASSREIRVDSSKILPQASRYYVYQGSMTSPPCSQGVEWVLFSKSVGVSTEQVNKFISIYRNNSRPIQGINKRKIYVGNSYK